MTVLATPPRNAARRKSYYEVLERSGRSNEITDWLCWFAAAGIAAQRRATALVEFVIAKARLLDRMQGQLNPRQHNALRLRSQSRWPGPLRRRPALHSRLALPPQ
jgi:hypothetical protein